MAGFSDGSVVKNSPAIQETQVRSLERFPGVGNGNPFPYSCLENSMDRGGLLATAHGVTKESDTHAGTVNHGRGTGTSDRDLPASGSQNK